MILQNDADDFFRLSRHGSPWEAKAIKTGLHPRIKGCSPWSGQS